jgi:TRAP transporter 4TM/12TM fusion protein
VLGLAAVACAAYLIGFEDDLYARGMAFDAWDWLFSALAVLLAMEFTRRATGWTIPLLILVALAYVVWWGRYLDGVFRFPGLSPETMLFRAYFGGDGLFGPIARISWSYVFMFILFGAFLTHSGAGDFIIRLARAVAGRLVGGPGLVAVVGSGLMGSVSGAAIANTVSTGVVAIPLMKRAGYPPRFAAAVEAAASTGGQLMPPVMGAGAFVMAAYTQIPYTHIVAVATLPALLYFLSIAFFVRIEAKRRGLGGTSPERQPLWPVIRQGWPFIVPMAVLVGILAAGFTPSYAAAGAILAVVAGSWLGSAPMGPRAILEALSLGARNMTTTAMLLIAVGLVVNVVTTTGIGNTFSLMIDAWAGGSLLLALALVALASLILGMGLPVTASYIVLGTLSAPALYQLMAEAEVLQALVAGQIPEQLRATLSLLLPDQAAALAAPMSLEEARGLLQGLPADFAGMLREQMLTPETATSLLLAAHLIVFWLSQDSNVTPPVCLTAYAAAAIAGSRPLRTGLTAWKLAKGLYIVPLLLAYTPLVGGDWPRALEVFGFAVVGLYALAGAWEGYLERHLGVLPRVLILAAALLLLWPGLDWAVRLMGLGILIVVVWRCRDA